MVERSPAATESLFSYARSYGGPKMLRPDEWTVDEIAAPNTTDKSTVITFATIAANAYVTEPWGDGWKDVKGGFNYTDDFGWQLDGLRGHIFADQTNSTVVIGLKGTSMAIFDGKETTGHDKLNDNLFGSCCCAQGIHYAWKPACDCMTSQYTCNNTCLVRSLQDKAHYYWAARDLYHNVTERYPHADIWLAGHSLGGVVSALLGLTYGLPTMTFETYPDALAASRLGLPTPPQYHIGSDSQLDIGVHHYGHTADPIFAGTCNAWNSGCTIAGYAFEGQCHTGTKHVYNTVTELGWHVSVANHRMNVVIPDVLEKYDEVPPAEEDADCQDCYLWKFFQSNGSETTTTSTSTIMSSSSTTATCKTPGWWGCKDTTTTTTSSPSSATTTTPISPTPTTTTTTSPPTPTTTCHTPGWFGCKDVLPSKTKIPSSSSIGTSSLLLPTTTTTTTTTKPVSTPSTTTTITCHTPGWWGCRDSTSTTKTTTSTTSTTSTV